VGGVRGGGPVHPRVKPLAAAAAAAHTLRGDVSIAFTCDSDNKLGGGGTELRLLYVCAWGCRVQGVCALQLSQDRDACT
jgi:hypothetical protein